MITEGETVPAFVWEQVGNWWHCRFLNPIIYLEEYVGEDTDKLGALYDLLRKYFGDKNE